VAGPDSVDLEEHPLKADPSAQLKLIDVQDLDARADQLRHRLSTLPELAELAELRQSLVAVDNAAIDARTLVEDLTAEQTKVDADVESVKARRERDRSRMDQGLITNPKDLEHMTQELVSLERRINSLEDDELEVMARLEDAERDLDAATAEGARIRERGVALTASRNERSAEIEAELAAIQADRGPTVDGVPADLLALYDRLRTSKDGVGAAALRARACGGCRLTLDPAELAVIKAAAPDEVIRCAECQRILVRTSESGL
jgi:uncharacterized protein